VVITVDEAVPCGRVFSRMLVSERGFIDFVNSNRFFSELRISSLVYSRLKKENKGKRSEEIDQTDRFYCYLDGIFQYNQVDRDFFSLILNRLMKV
jgi:hypothetical protein